MDASGRTVGAMIDAAWRTAKAARARVRVQGLYSLILPRSAPGTAVPANVLVGATRPSATDATVAPNAKARKGAHGILA